MAQEISISELLKLFLQAIESFYIAQESRIRENAAPRKHRDKQEKESVQRQVESTDGGIDKLVYKLYGLSEEEIGVVEGK